MATDRGEDSWSLEVVRGTDSGRRLPLGRGTVLLGNALGGGPGLDLSGLEANSPRKMAGRHAQIQVGDGSLSLRDLGSPGGTFVDRRRVPPGSDLPLKDGDLIQIGGVQLRVVRGDGVTARSPDGAVLTLKSGVSCRTWDDVLTIAAQRWNELRDELIGGSLAASLISSGNARYAPNASVTGSPDERLDAWIGGLPTSRPAKPELDVHPRTVVIRASGGGVTRKKVQISNVGYRLLKTTARVEPASANWLRISPEFEGKSFSTVDQSELSFDATIPESPSGPMTASIILESNGGTATVAVRVEPGSAKDSAPVPTPVTSGIPTSWRIREKIAAQSPRSRLILWPVAAVALRLSCALADRLLPSSGESPALLGPLAVFAALGALMAFRFGSKGSEPRDYPWLAVGGGLLGAMASAVVVAVFRAVEAPLGLSHLLAVSAWGLIGAASAYASSYLIPPKTEPETRS